MDGDELGHVLQKSAEEIVVLGLEEAIRWCGPIGSARMEVVDHGQGGELLVGESVQPVME